MKVELGKVLNVETIGEVDSIEASIDASSLPYLFELVSKNLYSKPIGSIVREITSNCVDSHVEAGVTLPVIIRKGYEEEDNLYTISFIDQGMGMSPQRIRQVYMKWFTSTKREDNTQLGAFGLGSKSPFAYQDLFEVITRFNGREYQYVLHRGESLPQLDLLVEQEITEHNGTEIKFVIKAGDTDSFANAIRQQLAYFDNVYVEGFEIDNNYQILEGNTFKYRPDQPFGEMHIVMDRVNYPINWIELGLDRINIPVGVKFSIGELSVTPNREEVQYRDIVKELVKTRITSCLKELKEKYQKQPRETDDIFQFIKKQTEPRMLQLTPTVSLWLNHPYFTSISWVYTPLKHLPITIPKDPFFMYDGVNRFYDGRIIHGYNSVVDLLKTKQSNLYYTKSSVRSEHKNIYIDSGWLLKRSKCTVDDFCQMLGLKRFRKPVITTLFNNRTNTITSSIPISVSNSTNLTTTFGRSYRLGELPYTITEGKWKIVQEYVQHIEGIVASLATDYQALEVPPEWLENYKSGLVLADHAARRRLEEKILIRYANRGSKVEVQLRELEKMPILVYGMREDEGLVNTWESIILTNQRLKRAKKTSIIFFTIANIYRNSVEKLEKAVYIKDFLGSEPFRAMIKNIATRELIRGFWFYNYGYLIQRVMDEKLLDIYQELKDILSKQSFLSSKEQVLLLETAEKYGCYDQKMLLKSQQLRDYFSGLEILMHISNSIPDELVGKVLRPFKKRINKKYYNIKTESIWTKNQLEKPENNPNPSAVLPPEEVTW